MFFNSNDPQALFSKISRIARRAGARVIFHAMVLWVLLKDPSVPLAAKATIMTALVYLITPFDAIPDLIGPVGFSDDFVAITTAINLCSAYITEDTLREARRLTRNLIGDVDEGDLQLVLS